MKPVHAPTSVSVFVLLLLLGVGAAPPPPAGAAFDFGVSAAYQIPQLGEDNYLDWLFSIGTCFAAMGLSQLLTARRHVDAP